MPVSSKRCRERWLPRYHNPGIRLALHTALNLAILLDFHQNLELLGRLCVPCENEVEVVEEAGPGAVLEAVPEVVPEAFHEAVPMYPIRSRVENHPCIIGGAPHGAGDGRADGGSIELRCYLEGILPALCDGIEGSQ